MTKEDVLQKANDYCSEKGYTNETLTDEFKEKFSEFFAKKYPETDVDDEAMMDDLRFNLNTAFSATSRGITSKQKTFEEKEKEYKSQIEDLQKKLGKKAVTKEAVIPKEIQEQLDELQSFRVEEAKKTKFKNVIELAKKGIRQDLHRSFETYAQGLEISIDKEDKEQADAMVARFQEIFRDSIGDIKPLAPQQTQRREEEFLSSLPKIKI